MEKKRRLRKLVFGLGLLIALLVPAATSYAWFSGWYSPNFNECCNPWRKQFSPTSYRHGQYNSRYYGGTEAFGSWMHFNSNRTSSVRWWSKTDFKNNISNWRYKCWSNCWGYYTHDHADTSCKLSARGMWTTLPAPKFDWDAKWCRYGWNWYRYSHESEIAVLSKNFPSNNSTSIYKMYSWYKRMRSGSGTVYETPQISIRANWGDYNTFYYDDNPQKLGYYTFGREDVQEEFSTIELDQIAVLTYTVSSPERQGAQVGVTGWDGFPVVTTQLDSLSDSNEVMETVDYVEWAKEAPIDALKARGVANALSVVTFNHPVSPEGVESLLSDSVASSLTEVKAVYVDQRNLEEEWTLHLSLLPGENYRTAMQEMVESMQSHEDLDETERPVLELKGLVSAAGWMPLEKAEQLNLSSAVFLADTTPSYLRMVTFDSPEFQTAQRSATAEISDAGNDFLADAPDGFGMNILPEYSDVYAELSAGLLSPTDPTSVSLHSAGTESGAVSVGTIVIAVLASMLSFGLCTRTNRN